MIEWLTWTIVAVAAASALLCVVLGLAGRTPSDLSIGSLAIVELLLIGQLACAIVGPLTGNRPSGSLLEFWLYQGTVVLIPIVAAGWALVERTRWSTVILGVAALAVAIMIGRMWQIWTVQGA